MSGNSWFCRPGKEAFHSVLSPSPTYHLAGHADKADLGQERHIHGTSPKDRDPAGPAPAPQIGAGYLWCSWAIHVPLRCCRDEARKESNVNHLPELLRPQQATKRDDHHPHPHRTSSFFYLNGSQLRRRHPSPLEGARPQGAAAVSLFIMDQPME